MSLLLEALKKAEKAKEDAQRRARAGDEAAELRLADEAVTPAQAKQHVTRPELPQITAPLEILSEDLRSEPPPAAPELTLRDARPGAASQPASRGGGDAQSAQRATARKVFETKMREPDPRLPFFIAMSALGVAAVGVVIYFWIQLRPPTLLAYATPVATAGEAQVAAAAAAPALQTQPAAPALPMIQGLPSSKPQARAAETALPRKVAAAPAKSATPAIPRDPPPPRVRSAAPSAAQRALETPVVAARRPTLQVHPRVEAGYAAYQAGQLDAARIEYQQALREEPANRDALLGLAAVEMRTQRYEAADAIFQRLLQADPRDAHAHAGMLALRSQQIDPVAAESRLKTLLASDPESGVLHFALGNQYAQQERWADARQAYLRAAASDPENPDFAYNLAVSLEHLRQSAAALDHYRRALALALKRNASFDPVTARARAQLLAR